jgi:ATP-dependent DNA helicase DinG
MGKADLESLLASAVGAVGGEPRSGQVEMAKAVRRSLEEGDPLLVQAGTGTGKSLAYLVPAIAHCLDRRNRRVVVATATLALQRQLVAHDLPLIARVLAPMLGREPEFALLKGRSNYVCRYKIDGGGDDEGEEVLFDASAVTELGRQVLRVREWAEETETGDRDDLVPGVNDRVWGAVRGLGQRPRVPYRGEMPLRRRMLRRGRAGAGPRGGYRRDEPRAARHRHLRQ